MNDKINKILEEAKQELCSADTLQKINDLKVRFLGKKGSVTQLMKGIGEAAPEKRAEIGQMINQARKKIEDSLESARESLARKEKELKLKRETIDITMPGKAAPIGTLHPLTQVYYEIRDIFLKMGFSLYEGPEVELDQYNF